MIVTFTLYMYAHHRRITSSVGFGSYFYMIHDVYTPRKNNILCDLKPCQIHYTSGSDFSVMATEKATKLIVAATSHNAVMYQICPVVRNIFKCAPIELGGNTFDY